MAEQTVQTNQFGRVGKSESLKRGTEMQGSTEEHFPKAARKRDGEISLGSFPLRGIILKHLMDSEQKWTKSIIYMVYFAYARVTLHI